MNLERSLRIGDRLGGHLVQGHVDAVGEILARAAKEAGWRLEAVIYNDMVGNISGINGVVDNTRARVFARIPPQGARAPRRAGLKDSSQAGGYRVGANGALHQGHDIAAVQPRCAFAGEEK